MEPGSWEPYAHTIGLNVSYEGLGYMFITKVSSQNQFAFAISCEGNFGIILLVTDVHPTRFLGPYP